MAAKISANYTVMQIVWRPSIGGTLLAKQVSSMKKQSNKNDITSNMRVK